MRRLTLVAALVTGLITVAQASAEASPRPSSRTGLFAGIEGRGCQVIRAEEKNGIARESRTELPEREDADEVRHAD